MIDTLKGAALIGTFIGVLITFAMWVSQWDRARRTAVEPSRVNIYSAEMIRAVDHSACRSLWMRWRTAGCRLI